MTGTWMRAVSLLLCGVASLLPGHVQADQGILACTHGADGEYATFELYDEHTASLRGNAQGHPFNCPLRVERVKVCGPACHVPLDFTVHARLDPGDCSTDSPQWARDTLETHATVRVTPLGDRMYWRKGGASACTAFRIDPAFAGKLGVAARNASAPPQDITVYVGLYPHEEVGGLAFRDHPLVRTAVSQAIVDAEVLRRFGSHAGPHLPIERRGDWLLSSGCAAHACPTDHWTVYVAVDGSRAEVCHVGPGQPRAATWYRQGEPPEQVEGACTADAPDPG